MADMTDSFRYLLEALRTPSAQAGANVQTGENPGFRPAGPQGLGPIEQRRDGYRLYVNEAKASGEKPVSYQEWFSTQQPIEPMAPQGQQE